MNTDKKQPALKTQRSSDMGRTEISQSAAPPAYSGKYSDMLEESLKAAQSGGKFRYDPKNDALYRRYSELYAANGQQAMKDTVGNAALMTGGYGSSYGVTAGQQAYNDYMRQLDDKAAELEQRAYERYRDEENAAYERVNQLIALDNNDYGRYRDSVSDYRDARDFDYKKSLDDREQANKDRDFKHSVFESERDFRYKTGRDAREQYNLDREYDRAVYENDRDYDYKREKDAQAQKNTDREYDRAVYESDRDYDYKREKDAQAQKNTDREFEYRKSQDELSQSNKDREFYAKSENTAERKIEKFDPMQAYEFIKKYGGGIHTEDEFAEALLLKYGDSEGFYDWIKKIKIPGDDNGRSYLDLIFEMHPELGGKTENNEGADTSEDTIPKKYAVLREMPAPIRK